MLKILFEPKRVNINIAENGRDGLKILENITPDVIVLDVMMPVMDGYEFIKKIKENPLLREIPVIILSACALMDKINEFMSLGAQDYLVKPFKTSELVDKCMKLLNQ